MNQGLTEKINNNQGPIFECDFEIYISFKKIQKFKINFNLGVSSEL